MLLALSALLSRVLGVVRDHLLAKTFGATAGAGIYNLDTYYAAFRIPDFLYNLLIFGAISAAFIPIFTQYKKKDEMENAWSFTSAMLHMMLMIVLVASGLAYLFAPQLTHLVAAGFTEESFAITVKLMRIMLLSPILFSFSAILISIQDSFKTFFFRSLGPLFYNLGIIFGILYFGQRFGVVGVTWGVIIGAVLQLIVQLPALLQVGYKHKWLLGYRRPDVREAFRLIVPRILGLSLTQLTLIVNTLIASFLMTGSITIFYLADNLQALPLGMIAISFAITSFATLSELAAEPTPEKFAGEIKRVMQQVLFLIIPSTLGMLILRKEIISLILGYGKFSAADAAMTATVLGFLLLSLFAQSLIPILSRGFYAYHNTKTPVITALIGSVVSVGGSAILAIGLQWGIMGIAIAYSAGGILNFLLLYIFMHRKIRLDILNWIDVIKMLFASLVMVFVVYGAKSLYPLQAKVLMQLVILMAYAGLGAILYFGMASLFKLKETSMIWRWMKKPVRQAPPVGEPGE